GSRLPHHFVKARDSDPPVRIAQARQRTKQSPRRARQRCGEAGVGVPAQDLEVEPDGESPLEAEADLRPPIGQRAAPLPEASVRAEEVDVAPDDLVEVRAPDLLL